MFENQTFEEIMERMLERISDEIDKRENSVIWNCIRQLLFAIGMMRSPSIAVPTEELI